MFILPQAQIAGYPRDNAKLFNVRGPLDQLLTMRGHLLIRGAGLLSGALA